MVAATRFQLGRGPLRLDVGGPNGTSRTLQFAKYAVDVPSPPPSCNWVAAVTRWRALGNLIVGNCTAVSVAHSTQAWLANEIGQQWQPPYNAVMRFYCKSAGVVRGSPGWKDAGADMLTVMNRWRQFGLAGHKISAFSVVDWLDTTELQQAIWLLGAVPLGIAMPLSVQASLAPGSVWDVPLGGAIGSGAAGSWGGHAIPILGYTLDGAYVAVSWNAIYYLTPAFLTAYCEEAYAPLSTQDWSRTGYAPCGFATAALRADLAVLATAA